MSQKELLISKVIKMVRRGQSAPYRIVVYQSILLTPLDISGLCAILHKIANDLNATFWAQRLPLLHDPSAPSRPYTAFSMIA